jgi:ribosomal 50S subunit-associated protein YjgA (DUF615 family)
MTFAERKRQLEYLLEMVQKGRCISVQQVAEKLDCSRRTTLRMLERKWKLRKILFHQRDSSKKAGNHTFENHRLFAQHGRNG